MSFLKNQDDGLKDIILKTVELHYNHPRIRAVYRSLRTNLLNLFIYKNNKK